MVRYLRALAELGEEAGNPGDPIRFTASTPGVKRDGLDLDPLTWWLDNYRKNPVVLWAHDYRGGRLPIGQAVVTVEPGRLIADVVFDQMDPFARTVESKYRRGFLHSVSVGWDTQVKHENEEFVSMDWHYEFREGDEIRLDLLDISGVPVPGDPDALIERQVVGLRSLYRDLSAILEEVDKEGETDDAEAGRRRAVEDAAGPGGAVDATDDGDNWTKMGAQLREIFGLKEVGKNE